MARNDGNLIMKGVEIVLLNLSGKTSEFNREGKRNFGVLIPEELFDALSNDGWNVKRFKVRDETRAEDPDAVGQAWLPVEARWDPKPPKIRMLTSRGQTILDEATVGLIDSSDIENVDIIVSPYDWTNAKNESGRKAYLKSMVVTIEEDELDRMYAHVPMAGGSTTQAGVPMDEEGME